MAVTLGRESRIKIGTNTVAKMTSLSFVVGNETIDITSFGDTWAKFARGMQNATASVSGFFDKSDTHQTTLIEAAEDGTLIADLRFYLDSTAHYKIDTTDSEYDASDSGAYIESFTVTADNNNVVAFDMSVVFSGPVAYATS